MTPHRVTERTDALACMSAFTLSYAGVLSYESLTNDFPLHLLLSMLSPVFIILGYVARRLRMGDKGLSFPAWYLGFLMVAVSVASLWFLFLSVGLQVTMGEGAAPSLGQLTNLALFVLSYWCAGHEFVLHFRDLAKQGDHSSVAQAA